MSRRRRRNPARRHRAHRAHARRRFMNPRRRHRRHSFRRRLRNPRSSSGGRLSIKSVVHNALVPAAIGAAGAVALNVAMGYATPYLPSQLQSGYLSAAAQIAGAVGVGMLAGKFLGRDRGRIVMIGGMTVVVYSLLNNLLSGINTSGIPGVTGTVSDYTPYPMGAYMRGPTNTPGIQGLGYVSPAAVIGPTMSPQMSGLGAYMPAANVMGDYSDGM